MPTANYTDHPPLRDEGVVSECSAGEDAVRV